MVRHVTEMAIGYFSTNGIGSDAVKLDERWKASGRMAITSHWSWEVFLRARAWAFDRTYPPQMLASGMESLVYLTRDGGRHGLAGVINFREPVEIEPKGPFALYDRHWSFDLVRHLCEPISLAELSSELEMFVGAGNYGTRLQGQPLKPIPDRDYSRLRTLVMAAPAQLP